ncbi:hypothetical protein LGK98_19670 [Clostridium tagluense]|uniref:hypothetical protein n=1 Tax=Clostridium tagluense TaxID=360422 RepID=UPI001CF221C2|nr:hypothetical protein [Clostridium tagluense]MCB2323014.1 hypothetical protein [Clostridium tagluense]
MHIFFIEIILIKRLLRFRASLIKSGIDLLDKDYTAAGALSLSSLVICMGNKKNIRRYARWALTQLL